MNPITMPASAALWLQTAIDHHMAGRLDEAESLYKALLKEDQKNAEVLYLCGVLAQQRGRLDTALDFIRQAAALNPESSVFLRTLANIVREFKLYPEAAQLYETVLQQQPEDLISRFNYAGVLQQLHRYTDALHCYHEILQARNDFAEAHNDMGVALIALLRIDEAAACFKRALAIMPNYGEAYNNLGAVYKNQNRFDDAIACYQEALRYKPDYAKALFNLGTIHFIRKRFDEALQWYRESLDADPQQIEAHQNVALILLEKGMLQEAKWHRDCAYRKQSIFIDNIENPLKTVVVLWASGKGNVPIDYLWPKGFYTRICCIMEYVSDAQMRALPDYDLVFNAIGDQDVTGPTGAAVERFRKYCCKPFLNSPQSVANTARDRIPTLFAAIAHTVCAPTLRCVTDDFKESALRSKELQFPIIVRPGGSHGGDHLVKIDSPLELLDLPLFNSPVYYASNYVNYLSTDGYFRKYRIVYVDRQAFPYHLAIGKHWIVHYETTDMLSESWKREEELAFLKDPRAVLGDRAMDAIEAIGRTIDLDYCGVDFSLLPDGRVLVFEANATMLTHGEEEGGVLQYKNLYVQNIFDAFNRHVAKQTVVSH